MIWMDGLDLPLVGDLDAVFFEPYPRHLHPVAQINESERKFSGPHLKPTWEKPQAGNPPLLNYKWEPTFQALKKIGEGAASPFDDVCFQYLNPHTGGPVLPTIGCYIQMIRPGIHTQAHRQINSAVYHVFEGRGYSIINGTALTGSAATSLSSLLGHGMNTRTKVKKKPFSSRSRIPQ